MCHNVLHCGLTINYHLTIYKTLFRADILCSADTIDCPKGVPLIQVSLYENSLLLFDKGSLEYFNYAVII